MQLQAEGFKYIKKGWPRYVLVMDWHPIVKWDNQLWTSLTLRRPKRTRELDMTLVSNAGISRCKTRLEELDREGEEDISRVHGVGVSHVVCLPSPLHVPCWVAPHQRRLCLSIDIGRKKHLEQPEMSFF